VISLRYVKELFLTNIAHLIVALRKDNFEGALHNYTDNLGTLSWSDNSCLALSLRAEWNNALELALCLPLR